MANVTPAQQEALIERLANAGLLYAPMFGIKVISIMIAQGCLEAAWGTSELAVNAKNYHGIKNKKKSDGTKRVPSSLEEPYFKVGSEQNADGSYSSAMMEWCRFSSLEMSVKGYYEFLDSSNAYNILKGETDAYTYLNNIKKAGYASSKEYVNNIWRVVLQYNLTRFDKILQNGGNSVMLKVMLDAGHDGQRNQSPVFPAYNEASMAWKLQNFLMGELEAYGVKVSTTRTSQNQVMDVVVRGKMAKGYDLFISLHSNACGDETVDRPSSIYLVDDGHSYDKLSKELGTRLANAVALTMGTAQAAKSYSKLSDADRNGDGKLNDNYYGVLYGCHSVGVAGFILENSFHTNTRAAKWLYNDSNLKTLAKSIAATIAQYYGITQPATEPVVTQKTVQYTVVAGDNLSKIAAKFNTTTDEIWALNKDKITNPNSLQIGWVLVVPDNRGEATPAPTPSTPSNPSGYLYEGVNMSKVFNPTYYSNTYPDLKAAYGTNATKLFDHFCKYGMKEGRLGIATFNVAVYRAANMDLQAAFGTNLPAYYKHYCQYGYNEGRVCM